MPQMKTAVVKNTRQKALRDAKKRWSKACSEMIKRVIAFKRGLNGKGDLSYGLPPGNLTAPLPSEVQAFESELASNFQQLMGEANRIEAEQAAYAAEHEQQKAEREERKQQEVPEQPQPVQPETPKPASKIREIIKQASKQQRTAKLRIGEHEFDSLLAISPQEQETGLMFCHWPPPIMAFPYPSPRVNRFWMKSTPSPLDIVFSLNGKITSIHEGEPYSTAGIGDYTPSDLVVELPRGTCQSMGIGCGDEIKLTIPNY
jgi:uncharacterized membrane protein (UPF0127 family)